MNACVTVTQGGDAQAGELTALYDGARPAHRDMHNNSYEPMRKQGAIILGVPKIPRTLTEEQNSYKQNLRDRRRQLESGGG